MMVLLLTIRWDDKGSWHVGIANMTVGAQARDDPLPVPVFLGKIPSKNREGNPSQK
jgi:hypothetical protein